MEKSHLPINYNVDNIEGRRTLTTAEPYEPPRRPWEGMAQTDRTILSGRIILWSPTYWSER